MNDNNSLKLAVYEKVVEYVLFLILRVRTRHTSMREEVLTITTSDNPSKGSVQAGGYHLKRYMASVKQIR